MERLKTVRVEDESGALFSCSFHILSHFDGIDCTQTSGGWSMQGLAGREAEDGEGGGRDQAP